MNPQLDRRFGGRVTLYYASCPCGWRSPKFAAQSAAEVAAEDHRHTAGLTQGCPREGAGTTTRRTWIRSAERGRAT